MAEDPAPGGGRGEDPAGGGDDAGGRDAWRVRSWRGGSRRAGRWIGRCPVPRLTRVLDRVSGPGRGCDGTNDDEVAGVLGRWEATEAWCAAAKLGVIRALIRRRGLPGYEPAKPGGLPGAWQEGLTQEVSNELGVSLRAADALIGLAAELDTRLVLTREALEAGVISLAKAKIIREATAVLDDTQAAVAETLIADQLAGKTPGQIAALIARAVIKVDPEGARKRRERAQQEDARVRFWREHAGTAALAAFGLPPGEGLAADQRIQDRALAYRAAGVPGTLDQLRVRAFLDTINGTGSRPAPRPRRGQRPGPPTPAARNAAQMRPAAGTTAADRRRGGNGTGAPGSGGGAGLAAATMLTIPLATLLGLAEHPGDAHGLGALDPDLARRMAAAAARDPRSTWCVTVTDDQGHAIGHGCARPARASRKPGRGAAGNRGSPAGPAPTTATAPGSASPPRTTAGHPMKAGTAPGTCTPAGGTTPSRWSRSRSTTATTATRRPGTGPSRLLRHLVEVRDGQCTQPTCLRAARRCDFEHAVPYHKGGRTCGCNGGCRCRRDHKVKQSPGWKVTQPRPGYHQWTTPAGRTYTTEPMRYPI